MATWDRTKLNNETCPKCGAVYTVEQESLPMRDKDKFSCQCGEELRSWKGTASYTYTLVSRKDNA